MLFAEHARLVRIPLHEFFDQRWLQADREKAAPGICESIRCFNLMSEWATSEVLQVTDMRERVACIEWFIDVVRVLAFIFIFILFLATM